MSKPFERHPGQVPAEITGTGEAANGLIRAVVGADGRVSALSLAPELRRLGPRGPVMDSETLATGIAEDFERALDHVATDIARAERRLER